MQPAFYLCLLLCTKSVVLSIIIGINRKRRLAELTCSNQPPVRCESLRMALCCLYIPIIMRTLQRIIMEYTRVKFVCPVIARN